jgi:2-C-methyl-D-erythritol 4-phosphate cytidylyltransferase
MSQYVVIAAGGMGSRMGGAQPKQFMLLNGRSVLWHTVQAFAQALPQAVVILVLPAAEYAQAPHITAGLPVPVQVARGGATRFESVKNGLALVTGPGVVLVHDAARCLVTPALIQRCYHTALQKGSAIPVTDVKDSLRLLEGDGSLPLDRKRVKVVQTPQAFQTNLLLPAFQQPYSENFTDEATVLEAAGTAVHLVEGEDTNIKITVPLDLLIAQEVLRSRIA